MDQLLQTVAGLLAKQGPSLLVLLVGFIVAILTWHRHPRVSLFTIGGICIFWIDTAIWLLPHLRHISGTPFDQKLLWLLSIITTFLLHPIGWGLIIAAIFSQRVSLNEDKRRASFYPDSSYQWDSEQE